MGTSENDFNDFYHDDPTPQIAKNKLPSKFITTGVLILGSILFFQGTFAGNISLNSGSSVEFGQGLSQTVACSGSTNLTLTAYSSFTNATQTGTHYLEKITVSNIPSGCRGADFTIRAYGDSDSTPLSLFNVNSKTATIQTIDTPGTSNDSGIAWGGASGISVSASTTGDAFTVTFTTPVAPSSEVAKITLESNKPYYYGGPGGGGGTVFYVSTTGFNCGTTITARCKYLEAAPALWNAGGAEPTLLWAQQTPVDYRFVYVPNATSQVIGGGYSNTRAVVLQGNTNSATSAAVLADSHSVTVRGAVVDDWYLPSKDELNQMCKWQRGRSWVSDATACSTGVGAINTGPGARGFLDVKDYWSSSQAGTASKAYEQNFTSGASLDGGKDWSQYVRPIRAF
jgi:hypothetical protein